MGSLSRQFVTAAGLLAVAACDGPCEFRIAVRLTSTSQSVGCCGAVAVEDILIPPQKDLAVDLAQVAIDDQQGGQDLFLTGPDCVRLFDSPYPAPGSAPRPAPRCPIILGPVSRGRVSPRAELSPGPYRVFIQAYSSNPSPNRYRFELSVWGASCNSPVAP